MERGFRLLHPMIPFVTEELWQKLVAFSRESGSKTFYPGSISIADFPPGINAWMNTSYDDDMTLFLDVVKQFRSMLAQFEVPPKIKLSGSIVVDSSAKIAVRRFLRDRTADISVLAKLKLVEMADSVAAGHVSDTVNDKVQCAIDPAGNIDFAKVAAKLEKKLTAVTKQVQSIEKKLAASDYETKVPEDIRQRNAEQYENYKAEKGSIETALKNVHKLL
eukprot:Protomagalhaensia_sp_Gyna_25__2967@NODE_2746_length_911_cov_3_872706_g2290_i0_p1_GENE_NODE_2746_length_911_cov_3_872706_g2290_i0NODE_2746_length_911_cov_3_872706_g2290_i0_p1_ORF_typecomplete_len219_score52_71Anticodon_1/PF08264_13/1_8e10Anticodon_1/PF08264_13/1_8e03Val_tRNAsynt_C/PF10458_9/1_6e10APG6/PF04111_12/0_48APG6/PF04111_12/50DNA_repr_REX1B/PF14966_6/7e03DNA_repr_REX1B/PF14966_6/0_059THOC7/PF05615_13/1_1e04THOC7/PF05615_13/0_045DUF3600/PF12207_8/0_079Macoilin/PF09726_9/0_14CCDC167/PF15188